MKHSKKLVSADNHSNIFNFHYTYLVTLVPVCKDDLVLLPKRLAESLGNISRLVIAQRITSAVQFTDPLTAQTADVTEEKVILRLKRGVVLLMPPSASVNTFWGPLLSFRFTNAGSEALGARKAGNDLHRAHVSIEIRSLV